DISRDAVRAFLADARFAEPRGPYLVGRRGYYRDTMGAKGANDIGVYDDAIALVTPNAVLAFNANTDPSRHRPAMATLCVGSWRYQLGIHGLSHPPGPR